MYFYWQKILQACFHQPRHAVQRSSLMFVNAQRNWWKRKFVLCCVTLRKNEHDQATIGALKGNIFLRTFVLKQTFTDFRAQYFGENILKKKSSRFPKNVVIG